MSTVSAYEMDAAPSPSAVQNKPARSVRRQRRRAGGMLPKTPTCTRRLALSVTAVEGTDGPAP
jgi:hypothetical protein